MLTQNGVQALHMNMDITRYTPCSRLRSAFSGLAKTGSMELYQYYM